EGADDGGTSDAGAVSLAGKCSRAAQCDRARHAAHRQGPAGAGRLHDVIADGTDGDVPVAARGRQPRRGRTATARAGARALAWQSDACGCAARDQPRPGALSDREVRTGAGGRAAGSGSVSVATVPPTAAGLDSLSEPPCSSALRFAMGRPSPPPRAFVVKKGSRTRSCNAAGMPGPLSRVSTTTSRSTPLGVPESS